MQATEIREEAKLPAAEPAAAPTAEPLPAAPQAADSCCAAQSTRSPQRWWLIGGVAALGIGLALYGGWEWLAATGMASVLIAVAPCLAMCALGLCAARAGKSKPEPTLADIRKTYGTQGEPPTRG